MTPPIFTAPPALFTPNFLLLFMAGLFFGLAFWPYVLLPVFLQDLGADLFTVGILMGAASLAGIVVRPWVGRALDSVGRRPCLITGGLIFFLSHLLYLSIDTIGWAVVAVRLLHGLGMGMLMAAFFTLAADLSPQARKTEGIAIFGISGHLSGTIGVTMGEEIIRSGGYGALFVVCAMLSLVSILFSLGIPEPGHHRPEGPREGFVSLSLSPSLRVPLGVTVAFALSLSSYMVFLKPYALSVGIGSVTPFFVAYTLTAVGIRIIGGNWPDRFGLKRVIYPAMVLLALGILLLVIFPTPAGLVASGILAGIGHGFIFPILSVMIIGSERKANQGSRMTLFTMVFDLGLLIGAPLLGWIAKQGDYAPMFIAAALVQVAALAAFVWFKHEE
jgi:MFS family permease